MGAKGQTKYSTVPIGTKYGKWEVVGEVYMDRYAKVPCRCECGVERAVDAYTLVQGRTNSCISCFNSNKETSNNSAWKGYEEIPSSWLTRYKTYSKKKGDLFSLSIEDVWTQYEKQGRRCALSNLSIDFRNQLEAGKKRKGLVCSASLDRIDSNKSYTPDNIQLVHKDVNMIKNAYDQGYFLSLCKLITDNQISKEL
jgi:hypothetical protein